MGFVHRSSPSQCDYVFAVRAVLVVRVDVMSWPYHLGQPNPDNLTFEAISPEEQCADIDASLLRLSRIDP